MLVAKEKVEYCLPQEKPKTITKSKKVFKLNKRAKVACSLLVFLAFIVGLFFTSKYAQLSTTGVKLLEKRKALAALERENDQLVKEAKRLQSLERIENIATKKLGMKAPESEGVYFAAVEYSQKNEVAFNNQQNQINGNNVTKDHLKKKSETFMGAISELWGNWLGRLEEAEAKSVN